MKQQTIRTLKSVLRDADAFVRAIEETACHAATVHAEQSAFTAETLAQAALRKLKTARRLLARENVPAKKK